MAVTFSIRALLLADLYTWLSLLKQKSNGVGSMGSINKIITNPLTRFTFQTNASFARYTHVARHPCTYVHIILITCAGQVSPWRRWLDWNIAPNENNSIAQINLSSQNYDIFFSFSLSSPSQRLIKFLSNGWTRERTHVVVANIVTLVINDFIVSISRHKNKCSLLLRSSQVNEFAHPWRYRINLNGIYCRRFRHEQRLRP